MEPELLPDYLNLKGSFQEQVRIITQNVRLSRQEVDNLNHLYVHLEGALQNAWPGCKVVPFGSIVTGLGIKSSDVDCFVDLPDGTTYSKDCVIRARNLLRRRPWLFQNLFAITTAKVPILQFFHVPTQRQCDVNFKSPAGVRNSLLVAYLLHLDKRALTLAVLIKYWSKIHNLTGTNLLSNYGLTMLVIFYLQQKNILPAVYKLQEHHDKYMVDGWNTAFSEDFSFMTDNCQSLYELLGGFFKFYSTVNFEENIISTFIGNIIPRNLFNNTEDLPKEFELYKNNISCNDFDALRIVTTFCVQDPFEHNRNCTLSVFPRLAAMLIAHFKLAAQLYEENSIDFYIIDIFARKPPIPPKKQKNKCNESKYNKLKLPANTIKQQIKNGKIMKPHQKRKRLLNIEALYRDSLKMQEKTKRVCN